MASLVVPLVVSLLVSQCWAQYYVPIVALAEPEVQPVVSASEVQRMARQMTDSARKMRQEVDAWDESARKQTLDFAAAAQAVSAAAKGLAEAADALAGSARRASRWGRESGERVRIRAREMTTLATNLGARRAQECPKL